MIWQAQQKTFLFLPKAKNTDLLQEIGYNEKMLFGMYFFVRSYPKYVILQYV